jgi:hypothetical protein
MSRGESTWHLQARSWLVRGPPIAHRSTSLTKVHGELAQLVALAAHGSVWLAGIAGGPAPRLDADNVMFKYVRRVRFELEQPSFPGAVASDVAGWLYGARARGIDRFWLCIPKPGVVSVGDHTIPDRDLVAFAGAGNWFVLGTSRKNSAEVWHASWTVREREPGDRGVWEVVYHGESADDGVLPPRPAMSISKQRLTVALDNAEAFARSQELGRWADWFAEARLLDASNDEPPFLSDMLPARGFSKSARRLLAMATSSWVFGGMGSWNDLAFSSREDEEEYERVSAELYSAVLGALVAGVNSELEH